MRSRCLVLLLALVALLGVLGMTGCSTTPAQRRTRALTIHTDRENMKRELDWMLGLEDASILWDYSFPPYW
jgi:hypothetical protein